MVSIPNPKNYILRDTIYTLIYEGRKQYEIPDLLKVKGLIGKKSRVSQLIKELEHESWNDVINMVHE